MALLTATYYDAIRAATTIEIPKALLTDTIIKHPQNLPMAEIRIRERITKLQDLDPTATFSDAVRAGGYNKDQEVKLKSALILWAAASLLPHIRQRIQTSAGEYSERFAELDWAEERKMLFRRANRLINELNEVKESGGGNRAVFVFGKAARN